MSKCSISRNFLARDARHELHETGSVEHLVLRNSYRDACVVVGWRSAAQTDPVRAFSQHELLL